MTTKRITSEDHNELLVFFKNLENSICNSIQVIGTANALKPLDDRFGLFSSCSHGFAIAEEKKIAFAADFLEALSEINYETEHIEQTFITPIIKGMINGNIGRANLTLTCCVSLVFNSFFSAININHNRYLSTDNADAVKRRILNDISIVIMRYNEYVVNTYPVVLDKPNTGLHNTYNKTLIVLKKINSDISSKSHIYEICLDVLVKYLQTVRYDQPKILGWFSMYSKVIDIVKLLHTPLFSFDVNKSTRLNDSLSLVAYSSAIATDLYNVDSPTIPLEKRLLVHDIQYFENRMFKKALNAIEVVYLKNKGRVENNILFDVIYKESKSILDELIENRLTKKQKFNN